MELLSAHELHKMAMNVVGKQLESAGYEFLGVNSALKRDPQFVCLKEKKLHFIIVRASRFPEDPMSVDRALLEKVKSHAEAFEAVTYFAGVGVYHALDRKLPLEKNQECTVDFKGLYHVDELL